MKHGVTLMLLAGVLQGMPAAAAPCVGAAYDLPLAGAVDVVMRYADVPSAQFPGIWQEGRIGGNFYQVFSNRVAILRADRLSQDWSVTVDCQQRPCLQTVTGTPPDAAKAVRVQLEQCLVPPEVKVAAAPAKPKPAPAPAPEPPKPQSSAIEAPEEAKPKDPVKMVDPKPMAPKGDASAAQPVPAPTETAPVANVKQGGNGTNGAGGAGVRAASPATQGMMTTIGTGAEGGVDTGVKTGANTGSNTGTAATVVCVPAPEQNIALRPLTCGLALIPPGTPEATLQRLLVLAGANPGRVDGSYGRRTKNAVVQVLGFAGRDLDLQQSISAVDAYLCRQGQPQP